jgi:hypothetical protein
MEAKCYGTPVPQAVALEATRMALAAKNTTSKVLTADGYVASRQEGAPLAHPLSQPARAKASGISRRQQQRLDKLARQRPDLHEEVKADRLTVNQANIQAGFVKEGTILDKLKNLWAKASQTA